MIWLVMKKSQCANHAVMEIWNFCALNYNSGIYTHLSWLRRGSLLTTTENIAYKYSLLFSNNDTYSHARGPSVNTTSLLLTRKVFFLLLWLWQDQSRASFVCNEKSPPQMAYSLYSSVCYIWHKKTFSFSIWIIVFFGNRW